MAEILFLGKDKPVVREALDHLHRDTAIQVVGAVAISQPFAEFSQELGIPVLSHQEAHQKAWDDINLAVSFLYPKKIHEPLISGPRLGCINFHPAPLPKYRGLAPYSRAILEGDESYGVSAHFIDEEFDSGDIIEVDEFAIDKDHATALSLERQAGKHLLTLFEKIIDLVKEDKPLPRAAQDAARSIYTSQEDLDELREVKPGDNPELVSRKVRAFFYPPHGGAFIRIGGQEFSLIDNDRLAEIASWIKNDE